jgi:uncharacterized membrane protein
MITHSSVEVAVPATAVWAVYADVERWPEWTASITRIEALDGPELAIGKRFAIKQPRLPRLVWEISELEPGASWTWRQGSPGGLTLAVHEVVPLGPERTLVRQRIDQRGPVGTLVGVLMRGLTRKYLAMEAAGLKARCEHRVAPPA